MGEYSSSERGNRKLNPTTPKTITVMGAGNGPPLNWLQGITKRHNKITLNMSTLYATRKVRTTQDGRTISFPSDSSVLGTGLLMLL